MLRKISFAFLSAIVLTGGLLSMAACTWRTEHKVETVHKIDAHIVLDIRQIKEEADAIEEYVNEGVEDDSGPVSLVGPGGLQPQVQLCSGSAWSWLDPTTHAWAADNEHKVSEKEVKDATERRRKRADEVNDLRKKQIAGENDHGYLELLDEKKLSGDAKSEIKSLLKDENDDRTTIYLALVQKQGGTSKQLPQVEVIYAQSIREKLDKGQQFRVPREKKAFEKFKDSKLGKRFSDAKPGDWVTK